MGYCQALTNVGAKLIKIKSTKDLEKSINSKTAMLWFLNAGNDKGSIKWQEFVDLGKKHNIRHLLIVLQMSSVENLFDSTKVSLALLHFLEVKAGSTKCWFIIGKQKV